VDGVGEFGAALSVDVGSVSGPSAMGSLSCPHAAAAKAPHKVEKNQTVARCMTRLYSTRRSKESRVRQEPRQRKVVLAR
jgi:hypothetical protein